DFVFCNGAETCVAGTCYTSSTVDCADAITCTADSCNEDTDSCDHIPNDTACNNGLYCDGVEVCDTLVGCINSAPPCPPEQYCREADDLCVECLVAEHCDDGDPCSGTETCEASGTCAHILSADCNDNNTEDECDLSGGTSLDCNESGIPDECDIAGGGSFDTNGNGVPDECDALPPLAAPHPYDVRTNRYISFAPNTTERVAFQLSLAGSAYFPGCSGVLGWIGMPSLLDISRVDPVPFFSDDWPTVVHAGDCEIVPVAAYEIRTTLDGVTFSDPLVLNTIARPGAAWWCDCVGSHVGVEWAPPNGVVNFDDIQASVLFFVGQAHKPPLTRVDVHDEVPNADVSFADVQLIVLAFQGAEYPYSAPCDCP
ncbi:MAG: hypothetical protein KJ749_13395, partial [Planctomycetes bacterium]|nr:hypothetical protein [Planctomycetota bacterium]